MPLLVSWAVAATVAAILLYAKYRRAQTQLTARWSEDRDFLVLENIDEIVFRLRPVAHGAVLESISGRVTDLLGYTPEEAIALGNQIIHPDDLARVQDRTRQAFGSSATTTFQYRARHRDGSYHWFENRLRRVGPNEPGGPVVFGVARNITERLETEDERRRGDEDLQQSSKMEALGRLAGGIAHDFNNLLTTIGGNASFIQELIPESDTTREALDDILAACDRAARFTRQLLAFSRKQVLQPQPLQVGEVVTAMQQMLSRLLGPEYQFDVDLATDLPPVACDRGQIEQVLMNLVVNARDAMPAGGRIFVRTREAGLQDEESIGRMPSRPAKVIVLEVADQGTGIPQEIRERIFEPFFTTKERGKGTGLGLAMVYGFVRQSGGHIELASGSDIGTTFQIYLPAAVAPEPPVELTISADPVSERPITVFVVDDEAGVRNLACTMLRRSGYVVLAAADGAEAEHIAAGHAGAIDVLLTDIVMPGIRGPELAIRLRRVRPALRVVYMSGFSDTETLPDVERGEALFLEKPFVPATLIGAIARVGTSA